MAKNGLPNEKKSLEKPFVVDARRGIHPNSMMLAAASNFQSVRLAKSEILPSIFRGQSEEF